MAGSTTFNFYSMATQRQGAINKDEMIEKFSNGQELSDAEKTYIGASAGSLRVQLGRQSGDLDIDMYDSVFVDGVSVRELCQDKLATLQPGQENRYMQQFMITEMLKRDKPIDFLPPSKINSNEPNPAIRIDTRLAEADLEQEIPKRGFWRTIGEALRIVKPQPTPQEVYEQKMALDTSSGKDNARGSTIRQSVLEKAGGARPGVQSIKEKISLNELEPAKAPPKKEQKIEAQKVVVVSAQEYREAEEQLSTTQEAKKLFGQTIMTGFGKGIDVELVSEKRDLTSFATKMEKQVGIAGIDANEEQEIRNNPDAVRNREAGFSVLKKLTNFWEAVPKDREHPDGRALKMSYDDTKKVTAAFDKDMGDLNAKLIKESVGLDMGGKRN